MKKIVKPFIALAFATILVSCGNTTSTPAGSTTGTSTPASSTVAPSTPSSSIITPSTTAPSTTPAPTTPTPTTPVATTPAPTTPVPSTPVVTTPTPTTPTPTTPTPTTPTPSTPTPTTPTPTTPTPTTPTPTTPTPTTPTPTTPTPSTPTPSTPTPSTPTPTTPTPTPVPSTPTPTPTPTPTIEIAPIIERAVQSKSLVSSGAYVKTGGYNGVNASYTYGLDSEGKDYFSYTQDGSKYTYFYDGESVIGIEEESNGDVSRIRNSTENNIKGFAITNFVPGTGSDYGVEAALQRLYTVGTTVEADRPVDGFVEGYEVATSEYSIYYKKAVSNYMMVEVSVTFKIGTSGFISELNCEYNQYSSSAYTIDDGKITISGTPTVTYAHTITQASGDKETGTPYDLSAYDYTAFKLTVDAEGTGQAYGESSSDTLSIKVGHDFSVDLYVTNTAPATASTEFDSITTEVRDSEGEISTGLTARYASYDNSVFIMATEVGTYTVTVSSKNVTKTFTVVAEAPEISEITISNYYTSGVTYGSSIEHDVPTSGVIDSYVNSPIAITYGLEPYGAAGNVTASVTSGQAEGTYELSESVFGNNEVPCFNFIAEVAGDYVIRIAASDTVYSEVTVHVAEAPSINSLLDGNSFAVFPSWGYDISIQWDFVAVDETTGTYTITDYTGEEPLILEGTYTIGDPTWATAGSISFANADLSDEEMLKYEITLSVDYTLFYWDETSGESGGYVSLTQLDIYFELAALAFVSQYDPYADIYFNTDGTFFIGFETTGVEYVSGNGDITAVKEEDGSYTITITGVDSRLTGLFDMSKPMVINADHTTLTIYVLISGVSTEFVIPLSQW